MRESKFRGRAKKTGEWVYGNLIRDKGNAFIFPANRKGEFLANFTQVFCASVGQFVRTVREKDIYENMRVLVKGKKSIGNYETVVIRNRTFFTLERNDTYFTDIACLTAIIKEIE